MSRTIRASGAGSPAKEARGKQVLVLYVLGLMALSLLVGAVLSGLWVKERAEAAKNELKRFYEEREERRAAAAAAVRRELGRIREDLADITAAYDGILEFVDRELGGKEEQLSLDLTAKPKLLE